MKIVKNYKISERAVSEYKLFNDMMYIQKKIEITFVEEALKNKLRVSSFEVVP
ncbi:hypothetical protein [Clostridium uliginosum]|uniref:hypothetical protein n=1 Tax=Clostridium uliginosum TaxID=119641 RepID=UPI00158823D6|nr:hypothetical protein [Clostridium uliginosum]